MAAKLVLANTSRGEDHVDERIKALQSQFKDAKFSVEQHETRARIIVEVDRNLPEGEYRNMQRVAQSVHVEPSREERPKILPTAGRPSSSEKTVTKSTVATPVATR